MSLTSVGLNLFLFGIIPALLAFLFRLSGDAVASRYGLGASLGAVVAMFLREATLEMTVFTPLNAAVRFWVAQAGSTGARIIELSSVIAALSGGTCGILFMHLRRKHWQCPVEVRPCAGEAISAPIESAQN